MYFYSFLHFPKTSTNLHGFKGRVQGKEGTRNAMWGVARTLKNMKAVFNIK